MMGMLSRLWSPWSEPTAKPEITVVFPKFSPHSHHVDVKMSFLGTANADQAKQMRALCHETAASAGAHMDKAFGILQPWTSFSRHYDDTWRFREDNRLSESFTLFMMNVRTEEMYNQIVGSFKSRNVPSTVKYTVAQEA